MYSILAAPIKYFFFYKKIFLHLARIGIAFIFKIFKNAKFFSKYKNKTHLPKTGGFFSEGGISLKTQKRKKNIEKSRERRVFIRENSPFYHSVWFSQKKNPL